MQRRLSATLITIAVLSVTLLIGLGCAGKKVDLTADRVEQPIQSSKTKTSKTWTVLFYGGVDSSAEEHIMPHLEALRKESLKGQSAEALLLIDRSPYYSKNADTLGEDFSDTRLFQLHAGQWQRVAGGNAFPEITLTSNYEANSGDAATLRKFIEFGKNLAPADNYLLLFFGHGISRSICFDNSSKNPERDEVDDPIYVAEITSELSDQHSVEFAWFDVCSFGAIENAYEFRPGTGRFSANVMLASPPISDPLPIARIFKKAGFVGRKADSVSVPKNGTELGAIVSGVIKGHIGWSPFKADEVWACYDLTAVEEVKQAIDQLASAIADSSSKDAVERIRGAERKLTTMNYVHRNKGFPRAWVVSPHFDLYDLSRRIATDDELSASVRGAANHVMSAVERLIIESHAGWGYRGFKPGKNGIYIVFPDGAAMWGTKTQWSYFGWYHADSRFGNRYEFGNYAWCRDGATPANATVENWFELLDSWYDTDDGQGGLNAYRW